MLLLGFSENAWLTSVYKILPLTTPLLSKINFFPHLQIFMDPKVSVVVPAYNGQKCWPKTSRKSWPWEQTK